MKHRTLLAIVAIFALVTLSCSPCGLISDLVGEESAEATEPPAEATQPPTEPGGEGSEATRPPAEPGGEGPEATRPSAEPGSGPPPPRPGAAWADVPIYPGASQVQEEAFSFPEGAPEDLEGVEFRLYETDDPVKKVASFYRDVMPKNGWEEVMPMMPVSEEYAVGAWAKNNGETGAQIVILELEGKTRFQISRSGKPE
jgi:hypothetical protein